MAERKIDTRVIDGLEFTVQQSSFQRAFALAPRAAGLFSPAAGVVNGKRAEEFGPWVLVCLAMFHQDPALLNDLFAGAQVTVDGKIESLAQAPARDRVFSGKLATAVQAALFAAEVEFGDFFAGVFVALKKDEGAATKTEPSPAESD